MGDGDFLRELTHQFSVEELETESYVLTPFPVLKMHNHPPS